MWYRNLVCGGHDAGCVVRGEGGGGTFDVFKMLPCCRVSDRSRAVPAANAPFFERIVPLVVAFVADDISNQAFGSLASTATALRTFILLSHRTTSTP